MQFRYGETYKSLAREWDVSYDYVRELGAEAHRIVRSEIAEPEVVTANVAVCLERVMTEAYEKGDYGSAIGAAREWTRLAYQAKDSETRARNGGLAVTKEILRSLLEAVESADA